jgi:hypothetical protein
MPEYSHGSEAYENILFEIEGLENYDFMTYANNSIVFSNLTRNSSGAYIVTFTLTDSLEKQTVRSVTITIKNKEI